MAKANHRDEISSKLEGIRGIKGITYIPNTGDYLVTQDQCSCAPIYSVCSKETLATLLKKVNEYVTNSLSAADDSKDNSINDHLRDLAVALSGFETIIKSAITKQPSLCFICNDSEYKKIVEKYSLQLLSISNSLRFTYKQVQAGEQYHDYYSIDDIIGVFKSIYFSIKPYASLSAIKEVDADILGIIKENSPFGSDPQSSLAIQALNRLIGKHGGKGCGNAKVK